MISHWMLHALGVASLLGLSALALERVLLALGRPSRWAWAGALALSLLLPLAGPWLAAWPGSAPGAVVVDLEQARVLAAAAAPDPRAASLLRLERALGAVWALASAVLAVGLLLSLAWLERQRKRWRYGFLAGRAVLVSPRTGPAVVGVLWPEIVVPEWSLRCGEEDARLLLAHEREHLRAGDTHLVLAALAALVLMPWNLPLWWQVRRLRLAIEVDCDARVLRANPRPRAYGLLLLEVGRRASRLSVPAAAFGEPHSLLERRIRLLSDPRRPGRRARAALALAAAGGLAVACELPDPARPELGPLRPSASAPARAEWAPPPTPYTRRPTLANREEFGRILEAAYPPLLRAAGIGGSVVLWVFISESGEVAETRVSVGSGYPEMDAAAQRALLAARFSPARNGEAAVPVWIELPVTFQTAGPAAARAPAARSPQSAETVPVPVWSGPRGAAPSSGAPTPVEVQPRLRSPAELGEQLERLYPPTLREAGVGGTVVLWVRVDARGEVPETGVARSSGRAELDSAAREAMLQARFAPALVGGRPVEAWIQLPVTFRTR